MNKGETSKIIIVAIVLALILAGIVWWSQTQDLQAPTTNQEISDTAEVEVEVQQDLEGLDELNIDAELESLDADLENL